MSNSNPAQSLAKFRTDLKHFEESCNIGASPPVVVIMEHLVRRIAEIEAALRSVGHVEFADLPKTPRKPQ
jgi:hypothetical protein